MYFHVYVFVYLDIVLFERNANIKILCIFTRQCVSLKLALSGSLIPLSNIFQTGDDDDDDDDDDANERQNANQCRGVIGRCDTRVHPAQLVKTTHQG